MKTTVKPDIEKKCIFGKCDHDKEEHKHGSCFHITQEQFQDFETNKKYCPCILEEDNIKLFADLGFMEPDKNDFMVTKTCKLCKKDSLININEDKCNFCHTHPYK